MMLSSLFEVLRGRPHFGARPTVPRALERLTMLSTVCWGIAKSRATSLIRRPFFTAFIKASFTGEGT